jgi:hypothetical protein
MTPLELANVTATFAAAASSASRVDRAIGGEAQPPRNWRRR